MSFLKTDVDAVLKRRMIDWSKGLDPSHPHQKVVKWNPNYSVTDITYSKTVKSVPDALALGSGSINNNTSSPIKATTGFSKKSWDVRTVKLSAGLKLSVGGKVTVKTPTIEGEASVNMEFSASVETTSQQGEEHVWTDGSEYTAPPGKKITVEYSLTESEYDTPFVATVVATGTAQLNNGVRYYKPVSLDSALTEAQRTFQITGTIQDVTENSLEKNFSEGPADKDAQQFESDALVDNVTFNFAETKEPVAA